MDDTRDARNRHGFFARVFVNPKTNSDGTNPPLGSVSVWNFLQPKQSRSNPKQAVCIELFHVVGFFAYMAGASSIEKQKHTGTSHGNRRSAWEEFRSDEQLLHAYNVKPEELDNLSRMAMLGNITTKRDYLFILKMMRSRRHHRY